MYLKRLLVLCLALLVNEADINVEIGDSLDRVGIGGPKLVENAATLIPILLHLVL